MLVAFFEFSDSIQEVEGVKAHGKAERFILFNVLFIFFFFFRPQPGLAFFKTCLWGNGATKSWSGCDESVIINMV